MSDIVIPAGTALKCSNCGREWATKKEIRVKPKTGVRCSNCHSRYIMFANGEWVVPSRKKQAAQRLRITEKPVRHFKALFHKEEPEAAPAGELTREQRIAKLKAELGGGGALPSGHARMVRGGEMEVELEGEGEEVVPEPEKKGAFGGLLRPMDQLATNVLPIDQIIDIETIQALHDAELQWLLRMYEVKKQSKYDETVASMARKIQRLLQLVMADMTIPNAIKIILALYAGQQLYLWMSIASEAPKNKEKETKAGKQEKAKEALKA